MTNTLSKPNIISGRRNFLKGAAALGGSAAMLAAINDGARAYALSRSLFLPPHRENDHTLRVALLLLL